MYVCIFFFTQALRELVFGTATGPSFNAEWRRQNFEFCDVPKLEYGLTVQHKVRCSHGIKHNNIMVPFHVKLKILMQISQTLNVEALKH